MSRFDSKHHGILTQDRYTYTIPSYYPQVHNSHSMRTIVRDSNYIPLLIKSKVEA